MPSLISCDCAWMYASMLDLQGWLDKFDAYRSNELHLSSESYGGHYLPTLALALVDANKQQQDAGRRINFKGD